MRTIDLNIFGRIWEVETDYPVTHRNGTPERLELDLDKGVTQGGYSIIISWDSILVFTGIRSGDFVVSNKPRHAGYLKVNESMLIRVGRKKICKITSLS